MDTKDMEFIHLREAVRDRIITRHGISPSLIATAEVKSSKNTEIYFKKYIDSILGRLYKRK